MVTRGLWSPDEDDRLCKALQKPHVHRTWSDIAREAGLQRCGKSCRRRWMNHLRPGIKRGKFSTDEVKLVFHLQQMYGNRWAKIAAHLGGRTDNDVKNLWHSNMMRRKATQESNEKRVLQQGTSTQNAGKSRSETPENVVLEGEEDHANNNNNIVQQSSLCELSKQVYDYEYGVKVPLLRTVFTSFFPDNEDQKLSDQASTKWVVADQTDKIINPLITTASPLMQATSLMQGAAAANQTLAANLPQAAENNQTLASICSFESPDVTCSYNSSINPRLVADDQLLIKPYMMSSCNGMACMIGNHNKPIVGNCKELSQVTINNYNSVTDLHSKMMIGTPDSNMMQQSWAANASSYDNSCIDQGLGNIEALNDIFCLFQMQGL